MVHRLKRAQLLTVHLALPSCKKQQSDPLPTVHPSEALITEGASKALARLHQLGDVT
jgi:hypothetical protein